MYKIVRIGANLQKILVNSWGLFFSYAPIKVRRSLEINFFSFNILFRVDRIPQNTPLGVAIFAWKSELRVTEIPPNVRSGVKEIPQTVRSSKLDSEYLPAATPGTKLQLYIKMWTKDLLISRSTTLFLVFQGDITQLNVLLVLRLYLVSIKRAGEAFIGYFSYFYSKINQQNF